MSSLFAYFCNWMYVYIIYKLEIAMMQVFKRLINQTSKQKLLDWHWLKYTLLYSIMTLKPHSQGWWVWSLVVLVTQVELIKPESSLMREVGPARGLVFLPDHHTEIWDHFSYKFSVSGWFRALHLCSWTTGWVMPGWVYFPGCSKYLIVSFAVLSSCLTISSCL